MKKKLYNCFLSVLLLFVVFTSCQMEITNDSVLTEETDGSLTKLLDVNQDPLPALLDVPEVLTTKTRSVSGGQAVLSVYPSLSEAVEVNHPLNLYFPQQIRQTALAQASVYIYNSDGAIPLRVEAEGNRLIIFPQLKMQPATEYHVYATGIQAADGTTFAAYFASFFTKDFDLGVYWLGEYGYGEKYYPEYDNAYYSKHKATLVYAHGWAPGGILQEDIYGRSNYGFETFFWAEDSFGGQSSYNGLRKWTHTSWLEQGWNVGIVYWTQFSDEEANTNGNTTGVIEAEAKIWSFDGPQGSRYVTLENGQKVYKDWNKILNFQGNAVLVNSITEALSLPLGHALAENTNGNIRFVGHSLGNQLATALSWELFGQGISVKRLALLDPAWTSGTKAYLPEDAYGQWTGERTRNYIFEMMNNDASFAVEAYHTTGLNLPLGITDNNHALIQQICKVNLAPWYYSATQLEAKHKSVRHSYFWSMESDPPVECTVSWWRRNPTGNMGPSAATPDWRIRQMMTTQYEWTQVEGRYSPNPADDWFERKTKGSWF